MSACEAGNNNVESVPSVIAFEKGDVGEACSVEREELNTSWYDKKGNDCRISTDTCIPIYPVVA